MASCQAWVFHGNISVLDLRHLAYCIHVWFQWHQNWDFMVIIKWFIWPFLCVKVCIIENNKFSHAVFRKIDNTLLNSRNNLKWTWITSIHKTKGVTKIPSWGWRWRSICTINNLLRFLKHEDWSVDLFVYLYAFVGTHISHYQAVV